MAPNAISPGTKNEQQQIAPTVQWNSLDEFQRRFCDADVPNIRLLAPAGSGKTQSLLWRCVEVHKRKEESARFLVVTFTRAARDELRTRLSGNEFSHVSNAVEVATLNGWGYRRVRTHHHSPRLLVSERDRNYCAQNTLQPIWKAFPRITTAMQARPYFVGPVLMNSIERLKTLGFRHTDGTDRAFFAQTKKLLELGLDRLLDQMTIELRDLEILEEGTTEELAKNFVPFWRQACEAMINQSLLTFEDQKYISMLDLQRQISEGRRPVGGSRLTHVLVDEFQDINPLDLDLIKAIVDINKAELTIVGDDDQAIFEWRGASPNYILTPDSYFGLPFETHILERNYRCPANIVQSSQELIVRNTRRHKKHVTAMNRHNAKIDVIAQKNFTDSIDAVMTVVRDFLSKKSGPTKLAIISRKRAQLIPYQILMAAENLPFCAAEDLQVFMSNAFENLRQMLLICAQGKGPLRPPTLVDDTIKLCDQVKRYPLKKTEKERLAAHIRSNRPRGYEDAVNAISAYDGPLKGANDNRSMSLEFASRIRALLEADTVANAIHAIGTNFSGLERDYGKAAEDIFYADPPFLYLAEFAKRYGTDFGRFIEDLDLAKDTLAQLPGEEDVANQADRWGLPIHLMTALRAKGKEFDVVVMLDVNDGIWPSRHAETLAQKEQERRLFYVGMTRAKRHLVLTLSGRIGDHVAAPSPFLAEAGLQ